MSVLSKIKTIDTWKNADCVCFDVDSTVCKNEAIDDLAHFVGVSDQVKQMYPFYFNNSRNNFQYLNKK